MIIIAMLGAYAFGTLMGVLMADGEVKRFISIQNEQFRIDLSRAINELTEELEGAHQSELHLLQEEYRIKRGELEAAIRTINNRLNPEIDIIKRMSA